MKEKFRTILIIWILLIIGTRLSGQNPLRFENEVTQLLSSVQIDSTKTNTIVFTGSSSIRGWKNFNNYFPEQNIINTGFGGSHMSDLLHYANELVIAFNPVQVFIYEGDNDLASGKTVEQVISDAQDLIKLIRKDLPECQIVFISAKPSPARWHLRDGYNKLNLELEKLTYQQNDIEFVSIWDIMLDKNKYPKSIIFTQDSLHMNEEGYKLWAKEIEKYLIH